MNIQLGMSTDYRWDGKYKKVSIKTSPSMA
jgi:hypothetical protein